jgi:hypothetical protein
VLTFVILLRAWILWALLLGQGVLIASYFTGIGWERWSAQPDGLEIMMAILAVSGVVGLVGEWFWRNYFDREDA